MPEFYWKCLPSRLPDRPPVRVVLFCKLPSGFEGRFEESMLNSEEVAKAKAQFEARTHEYGWEMAMEQIKAGGPGYIWPGFPMNATEDVPVGATSDEPKKKKASSKKSSKASAKKKSGSAGLGGSEESEGEDV